MAQINLQEFEEWIDKKYPGLMARLAKSEAEELLSWRDRATEAQAQLAAAREERDAARAEVQAWKDRVDPQALANARAEVERLRLAVSDLLSVARDVVESRAWSLADMQSAVKKAAESLGAE